MEFAGISVVVLETARAVGIRAQIELAAVVKDQPDALVSFATGDTFKSFFAEIERDVAAGRMNLSELRATHLDEFVGFGPDDPGGFAHELLQCAPLAQAYGEGRFLPVPGSGDPAAIRSHEKQLAEVGGIDLQFLGIGSNGHIAFSEPGTDLDVGFHRVRLGLTTRTPYQVRFAPAAVPEEAITAGPRSVLDARRLVMVAIGSAKAKAVRDMMEGDVSAACPASVIRRHEDVVVLLDSAAAAGLDWPEFTGPHQTAAAGR